jgi:hypothetical protein
MFNFGSIKNIFARRTRWLGSKEDFLEFIMMLANLRTSNSIFPGYPDDRSSFDLLCDSLGSKLLPVFHPDISPYENFEELRRNTVPTFYYTREVMQQIRKMREEYSVYRFLSSAGITPSRETMNKEIRNWKEAEDFACLLTPYVINK